MFLQSGQAKTQLSPEIPGSVDVKCSLDITFRQVLSSIAYLLVHLLTYLDCVTKNLVTQSPE